MFKKIIIFCFFMSACQASSALATNSDWNELSSIYYSTQLEDVVKTIQKLPEVNKLIATIQKEGPISIVVSQNNAVCTQFGACWDPDRRIISVNKSSKSSKGALIGSILFELQNALVNSKIQYYDDLAAQGAIGQEKYVRSIEYLEYQNSLKASQLADKGIQLGLFPASARLQTYQNFEEHYHFQKIGGHSAWIAYNYKQLAPKKFN